MNIAESMIEEWVNTGDVAVGLGRDGTELAASGYERQTPRWSVRNGRTVADVTFGPFGDNTTYDEVWIFRDGKPVDRRRQSGPVSVIAGMSVDQQVGIVARPA